MTVMSAFEPISNGRPFTGMTLDRVSAERKDPGWVSDRLADPSARSVAAGRHEVLISGDGEHASLVRAPARPENGEVPILLGLDRDEAPLFAADLDGAPSADPEHLSAGRIVSLRDAGSVLSHEEAGLAAYLVALLNWHRRHRFCANCGAETEVAEAGYTRHCPRCGTNHFPRTDPVVIMTVEHDGRLLLGRRTGWPAGRLSVLAGFVSPGESAEEAVIREVQEESGIIARDPVFVASQPWPFPASLMLGFLAISDGGQPVPSDGELEEVGWLTLDEVRAAIEGRNPDFLLPPSVSIARYLIERWVVEHSAGAAPTRAQTPNVRRNSRF
jgi:NAD+ diphosphatase